MSEQITPNPSVPTQIVQELHFPKYINNLGIIPTSYKDSMSYYECLAWLCKYLEETVIPTLNQNGEAVEELQGLYIELNSYVTNYFENLDVQEEINNKLDEMVTTGALQNIIANYFSDLEIEYNERYDEINQELNTYKSQVNSNLNRMNQLIEETASGSPAGVYATVSDLTTADPDHSKIYVVTYDGKWYYYQDSSSTWVAGGTYQSTGIPYYSISEDKTTFIKPGKNLIDTSILLTGKYINIDNGNLYNNDTYSYSPFIAIDPNENAISTSRYDIQGAFYDGSQTYISGFKGTQNEHVNFSIPTNAVYMRYSFPTSLTSKCQIEYGATSTDIESFYYQIEKLKALPIINNNTIEERKTTFINQSENIIDLSKVTDGYFRNYLTGNAQVNATYCYSDFIYCKGQTYITTTHNNEHICFYDSNYNFISGALSSDSGTVIPSTAIYVIVSMPIEYKLTEMVEFNSLKSYYTPFHIQIPSIQKTIYVGENKEFTKLTEAIEEAEKYNNCKVIVEKGTYNLVDEYTSEVLEETESLKGIVLSNGIHLIFSPQSKVTFNYTGSNVWIHKEFSPFNAGKGGFTIEGLNLECSNCRYCIHDEKGNTRDTYVNKYINCIMSLDNSQNPDWSNPQNIGAGFGYNGTIIIDNCKFNNAITFHTQNVASITGSKNQLFVKNSYCNAIYITRVHDIQNETLVANVNNCSITGWNVDSVPQITLYEYNNTIRTL